MKKSKLIINLSLSIAAIVGISTLTFVASNKTNVNTKTNTKYQSEFKSILQEESQKILKSLKQDSVQSFSSNQSDEFKPAIKDLNKFEKNYNQFINKLFENPDLDPKQLAKQTLESQGISQSLINKILNSNPGDIPARESSSSKSFSIKEFSSFEENKNLTFGELANKLWKQHVLNASFAAINFGLAIAYTASFNFVSAIASGTAGGLLTTLSVKYKEMYNELVNSKNWNNLKNYSIGTIQNISNIWSDTTLILSFTGVINKIDNLIKQVKPIKTLLKGVSWLSSPISGIINFIDGIQNILSLIIDKYI
ncbi:hypothetical protein [Mesomycoplasma conjunctivae]|uniref:hypothetical protein n=1 Tax=Mesomycoplasma conjunctivae TaxID=45361 RepID=UPI003DA66660